MKTFVGKKINFIHNVFWVRPLIAVCLTNKLKVYIN